MVAIVISWISWIFRQKSRSYIHISSWEEYKSRILARFLFFYAMLTISRKSYYWSNYMDKIRSYDFFNGRPKFRFLTIYFCLHFITSVEIEHLENYTSLDHKFTAHVAEIVYLVYALELSTSFTHCTKFHQLNKTMIKYWVTMTRYNTIS